jgi:hypothetical protein
VRDLVWEHIICGSYVPHEASPARQILDRYNRATYGSRDRIGPEEPHDKETLARILDGFTAEEQQAALVDYGTTVLAIKERRWEEAEKRRLDEEARLRWEADAPRRAREAEERLKLAQEDEQRKRVEFEKAQVERARIEREQAVAKAKHKIEIHAEATRQIEEAESADHLTDLRNKLRPVASADFLPTDDTAHSWLIEGIAVAGEPLLIGGPKKSLKTSLALDLAISLATGSTFLGRFTVPTPRSVVLFSGESGRHTLVALATSNARNSGRRYAGRLSPAATPENLPCAAGNLAL